MVFVSLRYHWDLLESSCHNFCTLLFAFCNKIQFLFDMVVYLLTYPVLTFNTNPLIARCLSALCRRSWGKDYSRPPAPPPPSPPCTFWCGNYHNRCVGVKLHFQPFFGEGRGAVSFPKQRLVVTLTYMLWFHFILDSNFIFFCFKLIIIHYNTQTQKKIKFVPRIKLNHNVYMVFNLFSPVIFLPNCSWRRNTLVNQLEDCLTIYCFEMFSDCW